MPGRSRDGGAPVIVHAPHVGVGRRVTVHGELVGIARRTADLVAFIRRKGIALDEEDLGASPLIEWREVGPSAWGC